MAFIKLQKARRFNYTPRHYDPDLEEFRQKRAERNIHLEGDAEPDAIRSGFSRIRQRRNIGNTSLAAGRPIRLFVIFSVLLCAFYLVLHYTDLLSLFIQ